jgi:hypothetical protein
MLNSQLGCFFGKIANDFKYSDEAPKRFAYMDKLTKDVISQVHSKSVHHEFIGKVNQMHGMTPQFKDNLKAVLVGSLQKTNGLLLKDIETYKNNLIMSYIMVKLLYLVIHSNNTVNVSSIAESDIGNFVSSDAEYNLVPLQCIKHIVEYFVRRYDTAVVNITDVEKNFEIEREKNKQAIMKSMKNIKDSDERKIAKRLMNLGIMSKKDINGAYEASLQETANIEQHDTMVDDRTDFNGIRDDHKNNDNFDEDDVDRDDVN